jgi:hypothetical protein
METSTPILTHKMHGYPKKMMIFSCPSANELAQNSNIFQFHFLRYSVAKFLHSNNIGNFQTLLAQKQN